MSRTVIGLIGLLIFLFALFAVRQWYKTQQHNQILAQQISDAVEYKEKYMRLSSPSSTSSRSAWPADSPAPTPSAVISRPNTA